MGKLLILLGAVLLAVGLLITYLPGLPWGRLPGDFSLQRGNFRLYFPLATCLLLSLLISLLLWLLSRFRQW